MSVYYEWDIETYDGEDIDDHDHAERLRDLQELEPDQRLVLVRTTSEDRTWAYVENGRLPERFRDAYETPQTRVPVRFHRELARCPFPVYQKASCKVCGAVVDAHILDNDRCDECGATLETGGYLDFVANEERALPSGEIQSLRSNVILQLCAQCVAGYDFTQLEFERAE